MKKEQIIIRVIVFIIVFASNSKSFSQMNSKNENFSIDKQIVIDSCVMSLQYKMSSVADVKKPDKIRINFMLLQIGKKTSKFSDIKKLQIDSILQIQYKQKKSFIEVMSSTQSLGKGSTDLNIFKNYPKEKTTVTNFIPFVGSLRYSEEKEKIIWKMEIGESKICGYSCKKATTKLRGRNYTAWYTEKIPISDGPWKFWGLPGIILKVIDEKGHYSFECESIQKLKQNKPIYILDKKYINTTRQKYNETMKKFFDNPKAYIEASGTIKGETPNISSLPYNPIELSE